MATKNYKKRPYRGKKSEATRETMAEKFSKDFVKAMEEGKPFMPTRARQPGAVYKPGNFSTLRPYSGFNALLADNFAMGMSEEKFETYQEKSIEKYGRDVGTAIANKYITYNQAKNIFDDTSVMKGTKADIYIKTPGFKNWFQPDGSKWVKKDENGEFLDPTKEERERLQLTSRVSFGQMVPMFNVAQIAMNHDLPEKHVKRIEREVDKLIKNHIQHLQNEQMVEDMLESMDAKLVDDNSMEPNVSGFYSKGTKEIHVRPRALYENQDHYMRVFFHEMTHLTGHEDINNRETLRDYGKDINTRAREELVAECGAAMMCNYFGIETTELGHAGYISSWLVNIKESNGQELKIAMDEAYKGVKVMVDAYENHVEKKYGYSVEAEKEELEIPYEPKEEQESKKPSKSQEMSYG